jgi:signal transduction histidine kinase
VKPEAAEAKTSASAGLERLAEPAWYWQPSDGIIVSGNEAAARFWGVGTAGSLPTLGLDRAMPAIQYLESISQVLSLGACDRHCLLFWLPTGPERISCEIHRMESQNSEPLLLVRALSYPASGPGGEGKGKLVRERRDLRGAPAAIRPQGGFTPTEPPNEGSLAAQPDIDPEDARTLAEIARMICDRTKTTGQELSTQPPNVSAEPARATFPAGSGRASTAPREERGARASAPEALLAQLSHELRTPVASIISLAEIMSEDQLGPAGIARYKTYSKDILEAARHTLALLNGLAGLSQAGASARQFEFTEVDVNEAVRSCLAVARPLAEKAHIQLSGKLDTALPRAILDRRAFKQVLLNLLANAIKFTPENGEISLTTEYRRGEALFARVTDNGPGIDEAAISRAMDAAKGAANGHGGNGIGEHGLGLPLSAELMTANGGELRVTRLPSRGTQAEIIVPMSRLVVP